MITYEQMKDKIIIDLNTGEVYDRGEKLTSLDNIQIEIKSGFEKKEVHLSGTYNYDARIDTAWREI